MNDLELALSLADDADDVTLAAFDNHDFVVETKPDMTPVTNADRAVEALISETLAESRPDDSMFGEEYGQRGDSERRWIIDPIDGTKNFVRGVPVWATLISLYEGTTPLLGVVSAPALGRRWYAEVGGGAHVSVRGRHDRRISVSSVGSLADASLSYSSLGGWAELGRTENFLGLCDSVWRTRAYGDFWSYMLLAEGVVDVACEPDLELYDMAALVPIVTEAGGRFTDLSGKPGPFGPNAAATNGLLHDAVLEVLG